MAQVPCVGLYKLYTIPYLLGVGDRHVFLGPSGILIDRPLPVKVLIHLK